MFFMLAFACLAVGAQQKTQVVSTPLTQEIIKLFPEISSGYIDFSGNGKADQTSDLNEYIPDSRVRDEQLQAQEILDFIVANWRFITLDKLKAVRAAVKASAGAISELIAINYAGSLDEAVTLREAMGDGLYLTPSAYKEAMERIGAIVSAMADAYKKEGQKSDSDFISSRDSLFGLIEKGYPLPLDLPVEEKGVLSTTMVSVILKEQKTNPARTRTAIRVLGLIKSQDSAPWLMELAAGTEFPIEAMKALSEIGYKPAIPVIANQLRSSESQEVRRAALQATGVIGGAEGLDAILELVKPANRESLSPDLFEAAVQALAGVAQKGNTDAKIFTALKELSAVDSPAIRRIATTGLGAFSTAQSAESLVAILGSEKDVSVRKAAVVALNRQKGDTVMPALLKLLKEKDLDPGLKAVALNAAGSNAAGTQAIPVLVESLSDAEPAVRTAATESLRKLFPANQAVVTSTLSRTLLASQNEVFLVEGTSLLSVLADPLSIPTLLALLAKPQSEVKRLAAWALSRVKPVTNPKVVEELQKLVTNENESIAVRVNAVRALGAIGFDSAQLKIWQTLVTTIQMRGDKYAMLRFYAVRSLGQLGTSNTEVAQTLVRIAGKDPDPQLRGEAVYAIRSLPSVPVETLDELAASFVTAGDNELKVRVVEALADLGYDKASDLAGELLRTELALPLVRRVIQAVSQNPDEIAAGIILDAATDEKAADFITAVLEGFPATTIRSVVSRRLRSETDANILSVLNVLDGLLTE